MLNQKIVQILRKKPVGQTVAINGWIKSSRCSKSVSFLDVNDGSCLKNLQVIADSSLANYDKELKNILTGSSVSVSGQLVQSPAKGQDIELQADKVISPIKGWTDD